MPTNPHICPLTHKAKAKTARNPYKPNNPRSIELILFASFKINALKQPFFNMQRNRNNTNHNSKNNPEWFRRPEGI